MRLRTLLLLPLSVLLLAGFAPADRTPRLRAASVEQLAQPLPLPYDAQADAHAAVASGLARAKASGRLLLIDLGANWCLDCRVLAGVMELPEMKPWVARHYEVVEVDIGRFDANLDIPRSYGIAGLQAVPAVLVIDPTTNRLRNPRDVIALGDARIMTPQSMANRLAKWLR